MQARSGFGKGVVQMYFHVPAVRKRSGPSATSLQRAQSALSALKSLGQGSRTGTELS